MEPQATMKYAVIIERGPSSFGATVPDLPGCVAVAATLEEVERLIEEAAAEHVAVLRQRGEPVPEPVTRVAVVDVTE
jgi:predicted RNase H-like HicB family nuclease